LILRRNLSRSKSRDSLASFGNSVPALRDRGS
jgi:hypothetical protein